MDVSSTPRHSIPIDHHIEVKERTEECLTSAMYHQIWMNSWRLGFSSRIWAMSWGAHHWWISRTRMHQAREKTYIHIHTYTLADLNPFFFHHHSLYQGFRSVTVRRKFRAGNEESYYGVSGYIHRKSNRFPINYFGEECNERTVLFRIGESCWTWLYTTPQRW